MKDRKTNIVRVFFEQFVEYWIVYNFSNAKILCTLQLVSHRAAVDGCVFSNDEWIADGQSRRDSLWSILICVALVCSKVEPSP